MTTIIVNETLDQLVRESVEEADNCVNFLKGCIHLPSFDKLEEYHQENTRRQLEVAVKRLEQLNQYFSIRIE
jgi:hypothetical protein